MPRTAQRIGFTPTVCGACSQSCNYTTGIDKGITDILRSFAVAIRAKGVNVIHPVKEMTMTTPLNRADAIASGKLTSSQQKNLSRARSHGLLARVSGSYGNWCITRKGIAFLKGEPVPKYAIIDKITGNTLGYWRPEDFQCSIADFAAVPPSGYWSEGLGSGEKV